MKDINKIFEKNEDLMNHPEVIELIDYCRDLEGEILDTQINKRYSKEVILLEFLKEISSGCDTIIETQKENKRFKFDDIDFEEAMYGLNRNIKKFFEDNNLY